MQRSVAGVEARSICGDSADGQDQPCTLFGTPARRQALHFQCFISLRLLEMEDSIETNVAMMWRCKRSRRFFAAYHDSPFNIQNEYHVCNANR